MMAENSAPPLAYRGPAFLSYGFRPFFLLASVFSGLAIALWLPVFYGEVSLHSAFAPRDWHVHEMLYGYLPAVITGFLLTAIPNWTGRAPIRGAPLLALIVIWVAGRFAVAFSAQTGWLAAMLIDVSFLVLVSAAALREIVASANWSNLKIVVVIALLAVGDAGFHLEAHCTGLADVSARVGIALIVLLIVLIAGRIVPIFTRNWLACAPEGRMPAPFALFDLTVVVLSILALAIWIVRPLSGVSGAALAVVGGLHVVRLARWAGERTLRERLLLILHIGYAFVPLGFFLASASAFDLVAPSAGVHAWMVGAAGIMTLAVMTRVSLGHTGRPLTASGTTQMIYAAVLVAASARICAAVQPAWSEHLLHIAVLMWVIAFFGFALLFGPMLIAGRKP